MRSLPYRLGPVVVLAILAAARPAAAQVLDPIQYALFQKSDLTFGCTGPCACPVVTTGPLSGTFTLYRTSVDPLFTHYALLNIFWRYPVPGGKTALVTGHGTYDLGGELALTNRMQLDLVTDGALEQHFDSGMVPVRANFPAIDIDVHDPVNVCIDSLLHVVAGPQGTESVGVPGPALRLTATPNPTRAGADVVLLLLRCSRCARSTGPEADVGRVEVLGVDGRCIAVL